MANKRNPGQSLGFIIHDVARLMRRNFNRRIGELGLTQNQWRALAHLARHEGINQVTLADLMETQPITLARLIDRLQGAGLVERRQDPKDRRAVQLYLTDAATPILDKLWALAAETKAEAVANIPEHTLNTVTEALQQMRWNLIASEAPTKAASGTTTALMAETAMLGEKEHEQD